MKQPCKQCSGSGIYIDYLVRTPSWSSTCNTEGNYQPIPCKSCKGTGWVDDEEMVTVPRKFVKESWWKQ